MADVRAHNREVWNKQVAWGNEWTVPEDEIRRYAEQGVLLEFSHTHEDQIGGQTSAGFVITGFYEDTVRGDRDQVDLISRYMPTFIATRAVKLMVA